MPTNYFPSLPTPMLPEQRRAALLQNQQAEANIARTKQSSRLADLQEQRAAEAHRLEVQAAPDRMAAQAIQNTASTQAIASDVMERAQKTAYGILRSVPEGTPEHEKAAQNYVAALRSEFKSLEGTPGLEQVTQRFDQMASGTPPSQILKQMAGAGRSSSKSSLSFAEGPKNVQDPATGRWHKETEKVRYPTGEIELRYVGQGVESEEALYRGAGLEEESKQAAKSWAGKGGVVQTAEESIPNLQSAMATMQQFKELNRQTPTGTGAALGYKATALLNFLSPNDVRASDAANAAALTTVSMDMLAARFNIAKGAISDMEFKAFQNSIPSLMNSEEGNRLIIATMEQINGFAFERAQAIREINSQPGDARSKQDKLSAFDAEQRERIREAGKALREDIEEIKSTQSRSYSIGDLMSSIRGNAVTGAPKEPPPKKLSPEVQRSLNVLGIDL